LSDKPDKSIGPVEQRLTREGGDKGLSLSERLAGSMSRLSYGTPLHRIRLKGNFPLKLTAVPQDPIPGDASIGTALTQGQLRHGGHNIAVRDFAAALENGPLVWREWVHSFTLLRDLAAVADRSSGAKIAEALVRTWLEAHTEFDELSWRPDLLGMRIMFWCAYAPYVLSSNDLVYRSSVLNHIARGSRHLERASEKAPEGLPRLRALGGLLTANLLIPGGEARQRKTEAAYEQALDSFLLPDGGVTSRAPLEQLELLELLLQVQAAYEARQLRPSEFLTSAIARLVPGLKGAMLGDGLLAAMHGGTLSSASRIERAVELSGIMARAARSGANSGVQRLTAGKTVIVVDAGPPPLARVSTSAHAGTFGFELSDGAARVVVACGGTRGLSRPLPSELAGLLRTTAAHSTLVLADTNSTQLRNDGSLGRGVEEVVAHRQESEEGTWLEATHNGYVRRYGLLHHRRLYLSADGLDFRGEDALTSARGKPSRKSAGLRFDIRFHLGSGVEALPTADGQGALLKLPTGSVWQFKARGGALAVDDSLWIDPTGRPQRTQQIVVTGETGPEGASANWSLKRQR
jgi:uncharacterized heparinase superfamily protein